MKRAAAIVGPTPAHVRWALEQSCSLRAGTNPEHPEGVFRQLRSLQELATAHSEGRVFDGVAWLEEATPIPRGFLVSDILDAWGGEAAVQSACLKCPANVERDRGAWAGCFGCVLAESGPTSESPGWSAIEQLQHHQGAFDWLSFAAAGGLVTSPRWFGLWAISPIPRAVLGPLAKLVDWLLRHAGVPPAAHREWAHFHAAIEAAAAINLHLHVASVPAGHSDGLHWTLPSYCRCCRAPRALSTRWCACCGSGSPVVPGRRRKVLGLRPYCDLTRILGLEATRSAYDRYRRARTSASS